MNERDLFIAALQIEDPTGRTAYLGEACGDGADLRQRVEALLAAYGQVGSFLEQPATELAVTACQPLAEGPSSQIGPYKLLEQIGEGGMGVVFMAEQSHPLERRVALKIIKAGMDTRQVVARFEAERQALAMMDHPHIARVLDAGATATGRPYFVMELVRGVPMTDFCNQSSLSIRERLELFVTVCQAVQHAHQKGIIHRDIKPTNVLVTLHDGRPTTKVIDFGVAKATGQKLTDKTLFTGFTQMIGTPLYMSPEQAEMTSQDIDTRSDIFSAGVLLYELLTGTTPFDGKRLKSASFDELRRIIREEEPARPSARLTTLALEAASTVGTQRQSDPRQLSRLFRGELDWIVMKCLEKDRTRRYETASALAGDVQRYLRDEPVLACPPSTSYRLRKFARRNKRALTTATLLGVMLLAAIGAVAGSFGWVMRDNAARVAKASDDIEDALRDSRNLQAQQKWAEALAVVKQAQVLLTGGSGENISQRMHQRIADLELLVKLEDAGLSAADEKDGHFDTDKADAAYATAFREYGVVFQTLVPAEFGALLRSRGIGVEVAAALDNWVSMQSPNTKRWEILTTLARAADPDPVRDRAREAVARGDRKALQSLAAEDQVIDLPGPTLVLVALLLDDPGEQTKGAALLRKAQRRHPGDFWLNCHLALRLDAMTPSQVDEAARIWTAALALRPKSPGVYLNLGIALFEQHSYDEAIAAYQQAIRLKPDYVSAHRNLGHALWEKGLLDEAIAEYRQAVHLKMDDPQAHFGLARALQDKGQTDNAIVEYREAICLKNDCAAAHSSLGTSLNAKGQLVEAVAECREAIRLDRNSDIDHYNLGVVLCADRQFEEALAEFQEAVRLNKDNADAHHNLAKLLHDKGRLDEAVVEFREVVRLKKEDAEAVDDLGKGLSAASRFDEATAEFREAIRLNSGFADAHFHLGGELSRKGQTDEAIAEYREAIRLKPDLADAHDSLGNALSGKGQLEPAIAEYRKAIRLKPDWAGAHSDLGNVLRENGLLEEAVSECREAVRLESDSAIAHYSLGNILNAAGQPDQAIAEYREAIRLDKNFAEARNNLGVALLVKKRLDEAIALFRETIRLKPGLAVAHLNLGNALKGKDQLDEAIAEYRKAIGLKNDYDEARVELGNALTAKGRLDEALAECRDAVRINSGSAPAHGALGRALVAKRDFDHAVTEFREAVRLKKDSFETHHDLGNALLDDGHLDEGIAEYRKAVRLKNDSALAHYSLGHALAVKGQLDDAIAELREAIRLKKDDPEAHHDLGAALALKGQQDEAIVEYREVIRLKKDHAQAYRNLCLLLTAQGRTEEAVAAGNEATRLAPNDAQALNGLAWLLVTCRETKSRDPSRAVELAKKAVNLAPEDGAISNTLGLAHLRAGNWKEAAAALEKSMEFRKGGDANDWFLLAIANWRMNHQDEARKWYDRAVEWMEKNKSQDANLLGFQSETEELLRAKE